MTNFSFSITAAPPPPSKPATSAPVLCLEKVCPAGDYKTVIHLISHKEEMPWWSEARH